MARVDVIMPQMGESIVEGTLSKWVKKLGDEVKRDETIFEISTDKVDAEIPSPSAGILAEILVIEGQTVAVQTIVARIETEKGAYVAGGASAPAPAAPSVVAAPVGTPSTVAAPAVVSTNPTLPRADRGGALEDRLRTKSSPLVRKIAAEHGIEVAALSGSGIAGRVTKKDILAVIESGTAPRAVAVGASGASMHAPHGVDQHGPMPTPWAGDQVEPMSRMRKLTSEHMGQARRVAAHVTTFFEIDLTRVARVRAKMRADFEATTGQKLTFLPFIISAVVQTLKRHPVLNASVAGESIIYRKRYNIGIAVALEPTGLIVPVIKNAEDLSLSGITKTTNDLAARARAKKLAPAEVTEATFTITNPGVFGSLTGTPIIPVGTTSILCLGAIEKRPKVITGPDGEDTIAIRTCAYVSCSFDHKVVDGADADRFMGDLKKTLETIPDGGF